jgi:hypothetical protein
LKHGPPVSDIELSVVLEKIREIVEAADYLVMSRQIPAESIESSCWPGDYHYERFAIICALYPSTDLLEHAAYGTLAIPLHGEALEAARTMMADTTIFGDFLDRLVEAHRQHEEDLDSVEALLLSCKIIYMDDEEFEYSYDETLEKARYFARTCRPSDTLPNGCYAYQVFEGNFAELVSDAAADTMERMRDDGNVHPGNYDDNAISRYLREIVPCEHCRVRVAVSFSCSIVDVIGYEPTCEIEGDDEELERVYDFSPWQSEIG